MRYLFEKNNSWFCYSTLLTQQTIIREGSLWKPLIFPITRNENIDGVFKPIVRFSKLFAGPNKLMNLITSL